MDKITLDWFNKNGKGFEYCDYCNQLASSEEGWRRFANGTQMCEACQEKDRAKRLK